MFINKLFEYLALFPVDHHGTSWVLASRVVKDRRVSGEELWEITRKVKTESFLDRVTANVPCAEGQISVTITQRGRLWLEGRDDSHLPRRRDKVYNLL